MEIARMYHDAQASFVGLARSLTDDEWALASPCTPGWTVRDVLSHVAGVSIDIVEVNLDGAGTDPWTAVQVERWRDTPVAEMLQRWDDAIRQAAAGLEFVGDGRPIFDCHAHEHDVRCAVGRPGNRDSELVGWAAARFSQAEFSRPLRFELTDGSSIATAAGAGEPLVATGLTQFELFRARIGRRSADQVRAWAWSEPVTDEFLDEWFAFGPAELDIIE